MIRIVAARVPAAPVAVRPIAAARAAKLVSKNICADKSS